MVQVFDISDTDQDMLAQFMGHNIRIHRQFYRKPLDVMQKARVCKVLMAVNEGKTIEVKPLDEVDFAEFDMI